MTRESMLVISDVFKRFIIVRGRNVLESERGGDKLKEENATIMTT